MASGPSSSPWRPLPRMLGLGIWVTLALLPLCPNLLGCVGEVSAARQKKLRELQAEYPLVNWDVVRQRRSFYVSGASYDILEHPFRDVESVHPCARPDLSRTDFVPPVALTGMPVLSGSGAVTVWRQGRLLGLVDWPGNWAVVDVGFADAVVLVAMTDYRDIGAPMELHLAYSRKRSAVLWVDVGSTGKAYVLKRESLGKNMVRIALEEVREREHRPVADITFHRIDGETRAEVRLRRGVDDIIVVAED